MTDHTTPNEAPITHGGPFRGYKLCECHVCGEQSVCTPSNDFYTRGNDDLGPLECEKCFWATTEVTHPRIPNVQH